VGHDTAALLKSTSKELFAKANEYALERGLIIADTKFEFAEDDRGNIILVDEILTPDSSRFWDVKSYEPGHPQPSFDKQFVREYLESIGWDKKPRAPGLPPHTAEATSQTYLEAYLLRTGEDLPERL